MFHKVILIILIHIILSNSTPISELNETKALHLISSQMAALRAEWDEHGKFCNSSVNNSDFKRTTYGRHCTEATSNFKPSGIYEILIPSYSEHPFEVACDATTQGGGWTIILRRMDGSVNFYRNWNSYKKGFGDLDGEFFLGLDKIHALTAKSSQELLIILQDYDGLEKFEIYEKFAIGDENEQYALNTLGKASGTAGDSMAYHYTMKFSTYDRDNDVDKRNCAEVYGGAWWYKTGHHSNLAGTYNTNKGYKGVYWGLFHNREYSLKRAVMMIRPRKEK